MEFGSIICMHMYVCARADLQEGIRSSCHAVERILCLSVDWPKS